MTYYETTLTVCNQCIDRQIDQWNRMESSEIDSYMYDQLIFDKNTKAIQRRRKVVFSTSGAVTMNIYILKNGHRPIP